MNCFWKPRYRTSIGIIANVEPAIITGCLVLCCPCREEIPADSVILSIFMLTINGHMESGLQQATITGWQVP